MLLKRSCNTLSRAKGIETLIRRRQPFQRSQHLQYTFPREGNRNLQMVENASMSSIRLSERTFPGEGNRNHDYLPVIIAINDRPKGLSRSKGMETH